MLQSAAIFSPVFTSLLGRIVDSKILFLISTFNITVYFSYVFPFSRRRFIV